MALIRLVEAWSAAGSLSPRARVLQGRAFHALRLMDRAMARAREVLDAHPDDLAATRLLAEVYLDRGWPVKARKPLLTLRDAGVDVATLWERAQRDPARPEANAREIERDGDPARMLALAEAFLSTGSFLRATGILERLRRQDPENARVKALLWGMVGDFGGFDLESVVSGPRAAAPEPAQEEPEHTESLRVATTSAAAESDASAFPLLFKYGAPAAPENTETEATQASSLATRDQMTDGDAREDTPSRALSAEPPGSGDTQIMLVLRPSEDQPAVVHRRKDEPDELRGNLNLRAWQASMGMSVGSDLDDAADNLLEEEDQDVVVMTRGEQAHPAEHDAPATFSRPIEVVEKHPTPPHVIPPEGPTVELPVLDPPAPRAPSRTPLLLGAAAFLAVLMVGVVLLAVAGVGGSGSDARAELLGALATQDYDALLQQEGRLEQRIRAGDAEGVADPLAEARLVLWSDYNGDPSRLRDVQSALKTTANLGVHRTAILRAEEALARGDHAAAAAALGRERPDDDEERLLFARIAGRAGDLERAAEHFDAMEEGDAPRYRLARAAVLADAGQKEEARALVAAVLSVHPDHPAAQLGRIELGDAEPAATITSLDIFLSTFSGRLPPRLEGRAHLLRARAYGAMGAPQKAREAAEAGLARDSGNPDLLFIVAGEHALLHQLGAARRELDAAVAARPGHVGAQTARVTVLLDMDQVEAAEAVVKALREGGLLGDRLSTLDTLVAVWGHGEPPPEGLPPVPDTPLGLYARALLAVQRHDPAASDAVLAATRALAASPDPFERRLAPRLVALRASTVDPAQGELLAREAEGTAGEDPVAHVYLGRFYEQIERRAAAAQHFDRAPQLGAEIGLGWYEKGRFYMDARDNLARTGAAWRNYLSLAPTGPRADRVKDTLGLR